jgi:hypothetical protein
LLNNDCTFADNTLGVGKFVGSWTYNHSTKMLGTIDRDGKSGAKLIEVFTDKSVMEFKYPEFVSRLTNAKAG